MKKIIAVVTMIVLCVSAYAPAQAQEVQSANVVGYFNIPIASNSFNMLAVPMQKIPSYRGIITTNTTTTITDAEANWTAGEWAKGVTNKENGASTFYLEVTDTNNAFEGRHLYILTNDLTTLTIDGGLDEDITNGNLCAASYKIVAANRVRDVFGEPGSQKLKGGSSSADADSIYDWSGAWATAIFFKSSGLGITNHWKQESNVVDDLAIDREVGFLVKRLAGNSDTNLVITSEVSANAQSIILDPSYNLIGGMSCIDIPIGQTGLSNVLKGGSSQADADLIYEWSNGWSEAVFWKTSGLGQTNIWRQGSSNVGTSFVFRAGRGYFFKMTTNNIWSRPSPLQ